jgi:mannose-6-phosphate isomerase-like protein (cupin superfamily)
VSVVAPGAGEVVGERPGRRVEILSDRDPVHVTRSRFGPGEEGADLHVHRRHSDLFYVLEGELTVRLGVEDEQVVVPAGSLARVPPRVVHGFRNASDADLRYLNFHAPGSGFAGYMRALRDGRKLTYDQHDPPAEAARPISDAVVESGKPIGGGVELLTDVEAIRVTRVHGSGERRAYDQPVSYYVLAGELALDDLRAAAGSWIQVPPGLEHAVEGVYLSVMAPSSTSPPWRDAPASA